MSARNEKGVNKSETKRDSIEKWKVLDIGAVYMYIYVGGRHARGDRTIGTPLIKNASWATQT